MKETKESATAWLEQQQSQFSNPIKFLVILICSKFVTQAFAIYVFSSEVSQAIVSNALPSNRILLILSSLFLMQILLQHLIQSKKTKLGNHVTALYNQQLKEQLSQYSLALIRDHTIATWQSIYLRRIPALQNYFCDYMPQKLTAMILPIFVLGAIVPYSGFSALLLLISAPLIPLFMWIVGKGAATAHSRHFKALERLNSIFLDRLNARQLLHVHRAINTERQFFAIAAEEVKQRTLKVVSLAFLSSSVLDFFSTLSMALIAVYLGFSLLGEINFGGSATITLQSGLFVLMLTPLFFSELKSLGRFYHYKAEAEAAATEIALTFSPKPEYRTTKKNAISLDQLTVFADHNTPLFSTRELRVTPRDKILLQGESGAGKTTLLEALLGMRTLHASNEIALFENSNVAWLSQYPVIAGASIRENLTLNMPFNESSILNAIHNVELEKWLREQTQGLDTRLGDYPAMSGGQQQRLAIARLLLFNKPVVFLDEPTAHLSTEQSHRITELLQQLLTNKTVIWISHETPPGNFFTQHWNIESKHLTATVLEVPTCA